VRGSFALSRVAAGARLEVDLLARASALASASAARQVLVGRLLRPHLRAGRVAFAVSLGRRGRAALRRNGRLALTLRIVIAPPAGRAASLTRKVLVGA
jgi:hypothetical protein